MTIPAEHIDAAQKCEQKWKIRASVSLAQDGIESAFGRFEPAASNNCFGIQRLAGLPYVSALSQEFRDGQLVRVIEEFAKFASIADAFDKHGELLATNPVYAPAMKVVDDPLAFIALMAPKYATAPNYALALTALIKEDDLTKFDGPAPIAIAVQPVAPANSSIGYTTSAITGIAALQDALNRLGASPRLAIDGLYGVLTRNAVRAFQGQAGIAVDGDFGPETARMLAEARWRSLASPAPPPASAAAATAAPGPASPESRLAKIQADLAVKEATMHHVRLLDRIEAAIKEWI